MASTDSQRQVGADADRPEASELGRRVRELMPQLMDDVADLVAIPSVSEVGYPEHTRPELRRAHERVLLDEFEKATLAIADLFGRLAPIGDVV